MAKPKSHPTGKLALLATIQMLCVCVVFFNFFFRNIIPTVVSFEILKKNFSFEQQIVILCYVNCKHKCFTICKIIIALLIFDEQITWTNLSRCEQNFWSVLNLLWQALEDIRMKFSFKVIYSIISFYVELGMTPIIKPHHGIFIRLKRTFLQKCI